MKFFICLALVAAVASFAAAATTGATGATAVNANQEAEAELQAPAQPQALTDLTRLRKAAYGGSGYIPSPPCPRNYLFSCQPNLSPVPCAAPAPSYGSQGAYSAPVPTYITPVRSNYGLPQTYTGGYVPQSFGYNQYLQY